MLIEMNQSMLYSDTLIPDIFISEYMPSMDGDFVKVYLQCVFLSKYNKHISSKDLAKKLCIDINKVKEALIYLESVGIITRKENSNSIVLNDLKEREIKKVFRPKVTSSPEEAMQTMERNKTRNLIVSAINKQFFQGLMSPGWYTDIDAWFDRFKFDEDVMMSLFQHCSDNRGLNKYYIERVAEEWHSRNIVNSFDLENYFIEYKKFKDIRGKIVRKLKLNRNLTEYEDKMVEKWVMEYKYDFDVIEMALKRTVAKTNPNFSYLNAIIEDWHNKGYKTVEDIQKYDALKKAEYAKNKKTEDKKVDSKAPQIGNFEQRKYDDDFYRSLYDNFKN